MTRAGGSLPRMGLASGVAHCTRASPARILFCASRGYLPARSRHRNDATPPENTNGLSGQTLPKRALLNRTLTTNARDGGGPAITADRITFTYVSGSMLPAPEAVKFFLSCKKCRLQPQIFTVDECRFRERGLHFTFSSIPRALRFVRLPL